jgi:hypothetical protein
MSRIPILLGLSASLALAASAVAQPAGHAGHAMPMSGKMTDDQAITSAMRAAPPAVAREATIVAPDGKGGMRTLRKGAGGFTCMADNPATPGPDPMCGDANAMAWADAWMGHKAPPAGKTGFMYMLEGGTDASNVDPYAQAPTRENHWVKTGPHVMVVGGGSSLDGYPATPQPDTTKPYVMWPGTPYAHLMIPVS